MKEDEFDDLPDYDSLFRDDDVSSITWNYIINNVQLYHGENT
jgi:hypothetical protein